MTVTSGMHLYPFLHIAIISPGKRNWSSFVARKDHVLIEIIMSVCDCILKDTSNRELPHVESREQLRAQKILQMVSIIRRVKE